MKKYRINKNKIYQKNIENVEKIEICSKTIYFISTIDYNQQISKNQKILKKINKIRKMFYKQIIEKNRRNTKQKYFDISKMLKKFI